MRDEFTTRTKNQLGARVGWLCSNPQCRQPTSGPSESQKAVTNVGVAAHITAASADGPRFNPSFTASERCSIKNGLWLCQKCAKAIDDDPVTYSSEVLQRWKVDAEAYARAAIEGHNNSKGCKPQEFLRGGQPKNVFDMLIVEDDWEIARTLKEIFLQYESHLRVSIARDGGEALEKIEKKRPDVLLLDLMMPYGLAETKLNEESDPDWRYTGLRLLQKLRDEERNGAKKVWVGVITASGGHGTREKVRHLLGSYGNLYFKPFDNFGLEEDVVSVLDIPWPYSGL